MPTRAVTRHDEDFDILSDYVDPGRSSYSHFPNYARKVAALYEELGIESALWAFPENQPPEFVERGKEYEYVLAIDESRVVAYVNESTWSPYIRGEREDFEFCREPQRYEELSLIIPTPIRPDEVVYYRIYRNTNGPDSFEIVEEGPFRGGGPGY